MRSSTRSNVTRTGRSGRPHKRIGAALVAVMLVASALMAIAPASAVPGSLDPDYGADGQVVLPPPPPEVAEGATMFPVQVATTPSGAVWTVEFGSGSPGAVWRLTRVSPSGVTSSRPLSASTYPVPRVAVDGEAAVVNIQDQGSSALARILPDLTLDPSFSGDGLISTATNELGVELPAPEVSCGTNCAGIFLSAMTRDASGRILVGFVQFTASGPVQKILRLLPAGTPDLSFGTGGFAATPLSTELFSPMSDLEVDAQNRIVAVTNDQVVRLLDDGSMDAGFGAGGAVGLDPSSDRSWTCSGDVFGACGLVVAPDGSIIVSGRISPDGWERNGFIVIDGAGTTAQFTELCDESEGASDSSVCRPIQNMFVASDGGSSELHFLSNYVLRTVPLPLGSAPLEPAVVSTPLPSVILSAVGPGPVPEVAYGGGASFIGGAAAPVVVKVRLDVEPPPFVPPSGTVSPASGPVAVDSDHPVSFSCSNTSQCSALVVDGEVPDPLPPGWQPPGNSASLTSGDLLDTSSEGIRTVIVRGFDTQLTLYVEVARARYDVGGTLPTPDGGTASTGGAPTAEDRLTTAVTTPVGGIVEMLEGPTVAPDPLGHELFDEQVAITAPAQSSAAPLRMVFQLHSSLLEGTPPALVRVWRDGAPVADCTSGALATAATPDPCVAQRASLAGGGVRLVVLSSQASVWTFGRASGVAPPALQPGSLDPTWGVAGVASLAPTTGSRSQARRLAVTPSGAVWQLELESSIDGGSPPALRLVRLTASGQTVGSLSFPLPVSTLPGFGAAPPLFGLAADGEDVYLVAGSFTAATGVVRRVSADLSLDPSFAGDGVLDVSVDGLGLPPAPGCPTCNSLSSGIAVDRDGKLLVMINGNGPSGWYVVRVLPSGQADPTFGIDGRATYDPGQFPSLAVDASDRILVTTTDGFTRLLPDGSLDPTFGPSGSGIADVRLMLAGGWSCSVVFFDCPSAIGSDGSIYFALRTSVPGGSAPAIAVLDADATSVEVRRWACSSVPDTCTVGITSMFATGEGAGRLHFVSATNELRSVALPLPAAPFDGVVATVPGSGLLVAAPGKDPGTAIVGGVQAGPDGSNPSSTVPLTAKLLLDGAAPAGVTGTTGNGGSLSTGAVPSTTDPLTTSVTTPAGGFVQLVEGSTSVATPAGYALFDQQVSVSAPAQTAATPLQMVFQLHSSVLAGTATSAIQVWRNGVVVPNCVGGSGATVANPDPCVKQRSSLSGGAGARITVLSSQASTWTFGKVTAVAPSAPTGVTATPGVRSASVSWSPPADDGGAPIGTYVVTATPVAASVPAGVSAPVRSATVTGSPAATSANVTSLVNGVDYTFTVKARNVVVSTYGPSSAASDPVTVSAVPAAPVITDAVAGLRSATVSWNAPESSQPITRYTVVATATRPDSTEHKVTKTVTGAPPATSTTVTGLLPGLDYSFTVSATSAVGTSAVSASFGPLGLSDIPAVPVISDVAGGIKSATVTWDVPDSDEAVTRYTVVATATRPDTTVHKVTKSVTGTPPATSTVMTGLLAGLNYSFTVSATSAVGTSATSALFGPVALSDLPGAPVITDAQAGARSATVSWDPSVSDESITRYTVVATAIRPDSSVHRVTKTVLGSPPLTSTVLTGLTVGLQYSFTVSATSAVGTSVVSPSFGPVTPVFGISITNRSLVEGNSGQKSFTFTVSLTDAQVVPVTVDVATADSTADSGDYLPLAATVTFDPGQRSKTVTVKVLGDTAFEPDEVFSVNLSNNSGGLVTIGQGSGIILNDDTAPLLTAETVRLAAGETHACAVRVDGTVRCWGLNKWGQIGNGAITPMIERDLGEDGIEYFEPPPTPPTQVSGLTDVVAIATGRSHTCALRTGGTVRCWGSNLFGQLGDGTTTDRPAPVDVPGLSDVVSITAGFGHTCALRAGGTVSCWGVNSRGELGDGTTTDRVTPTPVPGIGGAVALSSRSRSSCVLLVGGTVRCWGENLVGQLGNGTTSLASPPVTVSGLSGATSISVGHGNSCALLEGGAARCWGIGVLGDGAVSSSATQVAVLGLADAVSISAGGVSCALLADGTVRCWGFNGAGQLGDGTRTTRLTPVNPGSSGVTAISVADPATCTLSSDEIVRCSGGNYYGHLGPNVSESLVPRVVTQL